MQLRGAQLRPGVDLSRAHGLNMPAVSRQGRAVRVCVACTVSSMVVKWKVCEDLTDKGLLVLMAPP